MVCYQIKQIQCDLKLLQAYQICIQKLFMRFEVAGLAKWIR